jgi:xylan 1,4-beta-xylosidase
MKVRFKCDFLGEAEPLPHFWEHCVGSGHASLALRADWQDQLSRCRNDLGFQHVRFHGILDGDVGTLVEEKKKALYSFHNCDQIYDFVRSIGMRPIVELSFMPAMLASGYKKVFHYKADVSPPADYAKWATLVSKLASHLIERYGAQEVSLWPIEVWNEPNMKGFWTGSKQDYFKLFDYTHKALKRVHSGLQVGGPVTAKNAWIEDFIAHCESANVPPDFISTHTYPTDAFGGPDDDTATQLSKSHLGVLREQAEKVRKTVGKTPLYYTEWCTSSNPRDELHDDPYAAAYIMHTNLNMGALVDAYSYWTFSDIFEENYFPSKPFQGGFGLMNVHGIPKPAYRAYEILHDIGEERLPVDGSHETVFVWSVRGETATTIVIVNLALPKHPVKKETVHITLENTPGIASARLRRIDTTHANAKATWKKQGKPRYPTQEQVKDMMEASELKWEEVAYKQLKKNLSFEIVAEPQSITAIELSFEKAQPEKSSTKIANPFAFSDADEKLLDQLQSAAFSYFLKSVNPSNGLAPDSSKKGSACSISATGFALSCYPIGVARGWMTRSDAAAITLQTLKFFADSKQSAQPDATGYKGFYYHFLDMKAGKRANKCELSTIDTSMLLAGMVVAAEYFDSSAEAEAEIRSTANKLIERVNWRWVQDKNNEIQEAWTPENGFKTADWAGYTEALTLYVMGAASKTYPLPAKFYKKATAQYKWRRSEGLEWLYAAPLFIHLFPQAWMDLRGLDDGVIGAHDIDYFENSCRAIAVQRGYAELNPLGFRGYSSEIWGLSACKGPSGAHKSLDGNRLEVLGYAARGVPVGPDDGTLVPWAAATCLAHRPADALAGLKSVLKLYPNVLSDGRFRGAFNPSLPGRDSNCWVAPDSYGLDQGLVVMMIENARSGMIWDLTRNSAIFTRGLKKLGFTGGWLGKGR